MIREAEPFQDPLSAPVVAEVEPVAPAAEKRNSGGLLSFLGAGASTHPTRHGSAARTTEESDSEVDNFSAIGHYVGPPSQDETALYEHVTMVVADSTGKPVSIPEINIRVTDPRRADQPGLLGFNSPYMQYKITTTRKNAEIVVWRRFREFVSLDATLVEKFRGLIVPPRPEKNAMEAQRMKGSFIRERRLALEKYLNRLALHPDIKNCEELRVFLELEGGLGLSLRWRALQPTRSGFFEATTRLSRQIFGRERTFIQPNEVANTGKKTGNFVRMMKEGVQNLKNQMNDSHRFSEEEKSLRRKGLYVEARFIHLTDLSRAAEFLVKKVDKMSCVLGDMGLSLIKLSNYDEEEGIAPAKLSGDIASLNTLTGSTKQSGIALIRLARLGRKVTDKIAEDLSEIHEYMYLVPSVQRALMSREQALLTLQVVENQREGRQKRVDELTAENEKKLGGYAGKTRRIATVTEEIGILNETVAAAEWEYQRVKTSNFNDLERYEKQREADFVGMMHSVACVQTAYAEKSAEVWIDIARSLGATWDQTSEAREGLRPFPGTPRSLR